MLASTMSSASLTASSAVPESGERGRAISPVRADSRMPNGAMSLRNESIRLGFAELYNSISTIITLNQSRGHITYTSTIQLLLLISSTLPPN